MIKPFEIILSEEEKSSLKGLSWAIARIMMIKTKIIRIYFIVHGIKKYEVIRAANEVEWSAELDIWSCMRITFY